MNALRSNSLIIALMASALFAQHSEAQSPSDVNSVIKRVGDAQIVLDRLWTAVLGPKFKPPQAVTIDAPITTGKCRPTLNNAYYCPAENRIFIDAAFLARLNNLVSQTTQTRYGFAAVAAVAHEYGHAAAHASTNPMFQSSEAIADCFAGAATREYKREGRMLSAELNEAVSVMSMISDEKIQGLDPNDLIVTLRAGILNHGMASQRQSAFMRGYYGGPSFCTSGLGAPQPPRADREIVATSLRSAPPQLAPANNGCTVSQGPDGWRVRNTSTAGGCTVNLLALDALLPDHVRIELTISAKYEWKAGMYYGDARVTSAPTPFGFVSSAGQTTLANLDGNPKVEEAFLNLVNFSIGNRPAPNVNRLTLDIHHEGKDVYFIEYLNGVAVQHIAMFHGDRNRRLGTLVKISGVGTYDKAGLWLAEPGAEAVFSDFRVSTLSGYDFLQ